ncbi:MAG: hypothetical protein ACJ0G5_07915 [Alphaproteobacteria bacterium]|tara:strand:- start:987 stop:1457 length:471 start_codon:yes stop_codon:yes gene_type:complete
MVNKEIIDLVTATQQKWGNLVIEIGNAYKKNESLENLTSDLLHNIYAFNHCEVLFKPTLAQNNQFRTTKDEFLSYFLGQNKVCDEDSGFAIKGWKSIEFQNYKITEQNNQLLAMGNYYFKDSEDKVLKVEYTFGFIKVSNEELKINLHHSSLPYNG